MTRVRVVLVAAVLLSATAGRAAKDAKQTIQYDDDRLTLRVEEALAADILQEVARQSGAEVRGQIPTTRRVSAEFEHAPLKDGLERVLGAQNFTLTYAGDGRLKTIELKGVPEEGQAARAVVAVDPASASAPARASTSPPGCIPTTEEAKRRMGTLVYLLKANQVPLSGRLAGTLGRSEASLYSLLPMVFDADPRKRMAARLASRRALDADPQVVDAFMALDDAQLIYLARSAFGDGAGYFIKSVTRRARDRDFRRRAFAILRELRKPEQPLVACG
jgi:hypothetical protein